MLQESGKWVSGGQITPASARSGDMTGFSVSLSQNLLVFGAHLSRSATNTKKTGASIFSPIIIKLCKLNDFLYVQALCLSTIPSIGQCLHGR
jgi:hypothetical protein